MSLKNVSSALLSQIGFSEEEQQVYLTILGIGNASLGEMYLQTGLPFEDLQAVVDELHGRGYLKKIEGKINRYIAVEPFLKGFLFVEKEFQNDIIGIENSLINVFDTNYEKLAKKVDEFKESISPIYDKIADELRTSNEQLKMELTNSIYRHSDKVSGLAEDFDVMLSEGFSKSYLSISNELSNLTNEISVILREEQDNATVRLQKFEELVNNTIQSMLQPLDDAVIEYQAVTPDKLKIILDEHKYEVATIQKNIKSITKISLKEISTSLKEFEDEYFEILSAASEGYSNVIKSYKEASHNLFDTEQKKIEGAVVRLIQYVGKNIDQLAVEANNLKENIDELTKSGLLKRPDPQLVKEATKRADKIQTISQTIKSTYDEALNAYQKEIIEGMNALLKENDAELAAQLKQGNDNIKALKVKINSKWNEINKDYDKNLNDAVKDVLKETNPKINDAAKEAFNISLKYVEDLKNKHTATLLPLRDVVYTDLEGILENLFLDSSKRLRLHNDSNSKTLETIRYLTDDMKFAFKNQVQLELNKPKQIASEMISEYTNTLDGYLTTLNRDQSASLDLIHKASDVFMTTIKDSYTNSSNEISNRLAAIIYKVTETKTYLQEITNAVDQIALVSRPHSIIVYGNQNSLNTIYDMVMRTRSTCTIVVPTIDQLLVDLLTKSISKRVRVRVLADIDPFRDEALVSSLKEQGNITIWSYTMRDFYAVTRDGAEVLLAPLTREGELTSFVTEQDALVRAVQQIINASFMARSKEI
ncbi:MAG TPA: helix-turn-helix domain-containing protein [candidate division Zixibacteria bacterium]|nr:helix-turn-helix domain-containing protein [candidate division Zixibacteria bacterium]